MRGPTEFPSGLCALCAEPEHPELCKVQRFLTTVRSSVLNVLVYFK